MTPIIISDYKIFRDQVQLIFDKSHSLTNPKLLLDFLVGIYVELKLVTFYISSLEDLFYVIKKSLTNITSAHVLSITPTDISNILNARKDFLNSFQQKEFFKEGGQEMLKDLLLLQIIELIAGIESGSNFDNWENLSISMYIDAGISGLIDSFGFNKDNINPTLLCAFIEFGRKYE